MLNVILGTLSIGLAFLLVFLLVAIGWYVVWKLFLSRFKFVRELLAANNGASETHGTPRSRSRKPRID
uniref:Putative conserved secreted protein n=1 Tax=Ixodes ricinus TaxID=34613 RepID=A0A131XUN6_IXORI